MIKKILPLILGILIISTMITGCGALSVTISDSSLELAAYEEYDLNVKFKGADREDIIWSSSDSQTVKVYNGKITALKTGSAIITAKLGDSSATCQVTVTRNKIGRALSVDKTYIETEIGSEQKINAVFKESGTPLEVNVVWETSDGNIATVDGNGNIKALSRGKAIVSAYINYKGQKFTKDITVRVTSTKSDTAQLAFEDSAHTGSSLTVFEGNKTGLGFNLNDTVFQYVSAGGFDSRIFASGIMNGNDSEYDRLVFKIKFGILPANNTYLWLANYKKVIKGMSNLLTEDNCFLYYDSQGKLANSFNINEIYTVVVNLAKAGEGKIVDGNTVYEYGFALGDAQTAYLGRTIVCSEDYYIDNFGFEEPKAVPDNLNFVYAESGSGLNVGVEQKEEFDKYWTAYSSGTAAVWDNKIWNTRVAIGGINFSSYRNYEYMRFDMMLTETNFRNIIFWTGGYCLTYTSAGVVTAEGSNIIKNNDLKIYLKDGTEIPSGTALSKNVVYTFRVRIQRDNVQNVAFGMNINSATANPVYFANPTFTDY